ncbi:MAG: FAD-binding oxidoreductase [Dehalococcoidia bacterium]|nr:FAD-binding oxidoreductase [Dehalococcoidia bacterium]
MSEAAAQAPPLVAGRAPDSFVAPATLDELRDLVAERDGRTLVPVGGGTQLALGNAPREPFALVDVRPALAGEIEHEPADLTAVVPAGVMLGELDAQLSAAGQRLPLDPPHVEQATIGGVLAVGTGGPLRTRHGLPRDFVLGMTVLRADGELVKAGGRVVKNVTGYDLMRLWCGSLGTIGIVTSVAVRVLPRVGTIDLRFEAASLAVGQALAETFLRADLRPELLELTRQDGGWGGIVRLAEGAVPKATEVAGTDLTPCGDEEYLAARDLGFGDGDALTLRAACATSAIASAVAAVEALAPSGVLVRPLAREVRATWEAGALPEAEEVAGAAGRMRTALAEAGGGLVAERLPAELRGALDPWGHSPNLARMAAVKAAFDPDGRLNASRFVGGL